LGELRIENLTFGMLANVSFTVGDSECVGISGDSGAGKSLLLRAIADLDIHKGQVSYSNRDRKSYTGPEWRREIMLVPSETFWWKERVGEHLAADYKKEEIAEFCIQLGFESDVLQWKADRLSTGEKQRLGLLRSISYQPKVLLLDEPTAHLDVDNTQRVERVVETYRNTNSAPILWIAHDKEQLLRVAHRQFCIQKQNLIPSCPEIALPASSHQA